ncbi:MAG TPA: glycosyltransferase family 2 protein [Gemmatimonadales bacterium]|nr:glycosyltransferase family 2 protein [Gemmatimonadales bacterium]
MAPLPALWPALPWAAAFLAFIRLARRQPSLEASPLASGRLVSVIVPARNEEDNLPILLDSLLLTSYTPVEILVVDDRSTDDTAAVAARYAGRDPRVRLVPGAELPAGWFGKPWACLQGYRAARGDLLLFTDADTRHAPTLLGRAVGALESRRRDLVTVLGRLLCGSFWERVIMPIVASLLALRFHPGVVNRARRASGAIANGQFILVTRESYEAVGTHEVVKHEVAEDLALAQAYFRAGRPQLFAFGLTLLDTRMYTSLAGMVEGWSKNVYLGGRRSYPDEPVLRALVPVMFAVGVLFWLVPPVVLALGLVGLLPGWVEPAAWATAFSATFWMVFDAGFGINPLYGLTYPLGVGMTGWIFARSIRRGARRIEWRGRTYSSG